MPRSLRSHRCWIHVTYADPSVPVSVTEQSLLIEVVDLGDKAYASDAERLERAVIYTVA
jgi:hypothetical protein